MNSQRIAAAAALALAAATTAPLIAADHDLQIITPHNENIQQEFERGFAEWLGKPVRIRWIKKGTGQIIQQLDAQHRASPGATFDLDLFFGGGVPDHDLTAERGYSEPANLPAELLAEIPREIAGVANFGAGNRWIAAAHSSFGVLMNLKGLTNQKLSAPERWADLADPRMFSWVILADPRKSASVRVAYELVLQEHGWENGWGLLVRMAGNSRLIADSSSAIPNEIASGNVLAGPCIDFYAYARVAQAGDTLKYINPIGGAAITPDPISMLRKPPNRALAEKFIEFVLRPEGQRLWILAPGEPGGPREHALFRMPVRPDVCREHAGKLKIVDPYEAAKQGAFRTVDDALQRSRNVVIAEVMGAALVDLHAELKSAWQAVIAGGMKPEAVALLERAPFTTEESAAHNLSLSAGGRDARKLVRQWTDEARARYKQAEKAAK